MEKWYDSETLDMFRQFEAKRLRTPSNIFLAYVFIKGKKVMAFVNNETKVGYKCQETIPAIKMPLEEIKYDTFDRWCTSFDT